MNGDDPQRTLRGEEQEVTPPTLTLSGGDASSLLLGWGGGSSSKGSGCQHSLPSAVRDEASAAGRQWGKGRKQGASWRKAIVKPYDLRHHC